MTNWVREDANLKPDNVTD